METELVPWPIHMLGRMVNSAPGLFIEIGDIENSLMATRIKDVLIDRPVFIAGLARSGSTLLLEIAASHPSAATHKNRDFPLVHAPMLWNRIVDMMQSPDNAPKERPHGDGMMINGESPEAMEEPLWMAFFPHLHNPAVKNTLGRETSNRKFEEFYKNHIRKVIHIRGGARYISKGNYNVSRIGYLARLFPDARFVIPVRAPVPHIGSLLRQHRRFTKIHQAHPRSLASMRQGGHFEFGADLRPINFGGPNLCQAMLSEDRKVCVEGWATYWSQVHDHIRALLDSDEDIKSRTMVVRFEDKCQSPEKTIKDYLSFLDLEDNSITATFAPRIIAPNYYDPGFTEEDVALIMERTAYARENFGY
ncbi:MAG: sulfotransferase [Nitrospinota bacterium]|nr:sulfotransferase [Nitrospinota bacterium]